MCPFKPCIFLEKLNLTIGKERALLASQYMNFNTKMFRLKKLRFAKENSKKLVLISFYVAALHQSMFEYQPFRKQSI